MGRALFRRALTEDELEARLAIAGQSAANLGDSGGSSAAAQCGHRDFRGPAGETGIDNQIARVTGCIKGYRPGGDSFAGALAAVRDGSLTVLLEVTGVDDSRNDTEVRVRLFASEDDVLFDRVSDRGIADESFSVHPDERFHGSEARGHIADGVLSTGPFDLRIPLQVQVVDSEYDFRDAHIRLTLAEDGSARGTLGAYQPVENMYEILAGHSRARSAAWVIGFTCPAIYAALIGEADGHRDPETGQCTTLSTAYQLDAVPAFVIRSES